MNSAIVTGGASGLGLATTKRLILKGLKVLVCDIQRPKDLTSSDNWDFIKTDVSSEDDAKKAIEKVSQDFGNFRYLINCAGIGHAERIFNPKKNSVHSLEKFENILRVNTFGTFNMMRLSIEEFSKNAPNENMERGVIINTASVAAFEGQIGQVAYSASKGAIVGMTLPVARDVCRLGIRVMAIAPGLFLTPLLEELPEKVQNQLAENVPFPKRLGNPSEFGMLVESIIDNPMLNGEVIRIDGALRMPP